MLNFTALAELSTRQIAETAAAVDLQETKIVLCARVTLLGGLAIPEGRLSIILRYTEALVVHKNNMILRKGIPALG